MKSDVADQLTAAERQQQNSDRERHDVYASLAVLKGFNQALETSFDELSDAYQQMVDAHAGVLQAEKPARVADLETDCRNCLSRVKSSVERLDTHLNAQQWPRGSAEQDNRSDAA